jgi:hypothetical protein
VRACFVTIRMLNSLIVPVTFETFSVARGFNDFKKLPKSAIVKNDYVTVRLL